MIIAKQEVNRQFFLILPLCSDPATTIILIYNVLDEHFTQNHYLISTKTNKRRLIGDFTE